MVDYLTASKLIAIGRDARGDGPESPTISDLDLVNLGGTYAASMHPWQWLARRSVRLDVRARVDVADATWDEATLTLTSVGAFADYVFVTGDRFEVLSGTGADTSALLRVASRTSDDAIVLAETLDDGSGTADGATDVAGSLLRHHVLLPDDLQSIVTIQPTSNLLRCMVPLASGGLQTLRSSTGLAPAFGYVYDVAWLEVDGRLYPALELWPDATADEPNSLTLWYRADWRVLTADEDRVVWPAWLYPVLWRVVRETFKAFAEEDEGSLEARLEPIKRSELFMSLARRDGAMVPRYRPGHGSTVERMLPTDEGLGVAPFVVPQP